MVRGEGPRYEVPRCEVPRYEVPRAWRGVSTRGRQLSDRTSQVDFETPPCIERWFRRVYRVAIDPEPEAVVHVVVDVDVVLDVRLPERLHERVDLIRRNPLVLAGERAVHG